MTVKKWLPCSMWDFQGLEDWLNEQAANGYALVDWPGFSDIGRISFEKDSTAPGARYRLEPIDDKGNQKERNALYAQMGWRYVSQIHQLYTVYRCDDPQAPELYTDPESLALTLKKLVKRQRLALILVPLWIAFLLRDGIYQLFTEPAVIPMNIILGADLLLPFTLVLLALIGLEILLPIRRFVLFRRLKSQLAQGMIPKAGKRRYQEPAGFFLSLILVAFIVFWLVQSVSGRYDSQQLEGLEDWDFPHITLADVLSPGQDLQLEADNGSFQHSWLAPEQYHIYQKGTVVLTDGTRQTASLTLRYIRTLSPALAEMVYRGAVQERLEDFGIYPDINDLNVLHQSVLIFLESRDVEHPTFDRLTEILYQFDDEEAPRCIYVGQMGDQVIVLSTSLSQNRQEPLELLAQQLSDSVP